MKRFLAVATIGALVAFTLGAPSAEAAQSAAAQARPVDRTGNQTLGWLPWFGCWRPADERAPEQGVLVCVVPTGTNGARMMTLAGDQAVVDDTFVADGVARPVVEPGCRGTRTNDWSRSGRLFAVAELACEGQPLRKVSGLSFIAAGGDWVDIQAVTTGDRETVRVRRYRHTSELPPDASLPPAVTARAVESFAVARLAPFTLDDVVEASGRVSAAAIEAAVVETQAIFPLSSRTLIALDKANVPDSVIDLMVAQTFPKQFQVKRRGFESSSSSWSGLGGSGIGWDLYDFDPFYTYYSPLGYGYWNRFGDYYYYGPGTGAIITPGGGAAAAPSGDHGRVVNGGGYTQVSTRGPAVEGTRGLSGGDAVSTGSEGSSGGTSSGSSAGGGSGVSSGGYSSGGGGDSGRSAVPR